MIFVAILLSGFILFLCKCLTLFDCTGVILFLVLNCVVSALHRSESRNSIVSNGGGGYPRTPTGGVSLAGMGSNRRPSTTPNNARTASKGPSRRGSVTYITQENNTGRTSFLVELYCAFLVY